MLVLNGEPHFRAIRANFGHVHRLGQDRQGVEGSRRFGPTIVADFPYSLPQLVDEEGDLAVAKLLIDPAGPAGVVIPLAVSRVLVASEADQPGMLARSSSSPVICLNRAAAESASNRISPQFPGV